ncbi:MAG: hypothetical protein A2020_05790 [Lentisphaerae bacterium GWF2_45_14]|nr:MAG: hypothetical protein A2020_05790 [Lentisphaerae bacterium GWF2_45_14]
MSFKTFNRIYIHVPFCSSKCAYCAFYSVAGAAQPRIENYLEKLRRDFKKYAPSCPAPQSIFIGGGTPNSLNASSLENLFSIIADSFNLESVSEFSIECNPESLDEKKAAVISKYADRVSMGVQSFSPALRKVLGRNGNPETFYNALNLLNSKGIENIGTDLIYAIPGQTLEEWSSELSQAVDSGVKHISAYSLTIEEGSSLASDKNIKVPDDELSATMWETAGQILGKKNFLRYEISNYSRPSFECRHNTDIWLGDTYIGFGPAASSFDGSDRWTNPPDISQWLAGKDPEMDIITPEKRLREIFVMGLRLTDGWDIERFRGKAGNALTEKIIGECQFFSSENLMEITEKNLRLNDKGLLLWNTVSSELL